MYTDLYVLENILNYIKDVGSRRDDRNKKGCGRTACLADVNKVQRANVTH